MHAAAPTKGDPAAAAASLSLPGPRERPVLFLRAGAAGPASTLFHRVDRQEGALEQSGHGNFPHLEELDHGWLAGLLMRKQKKGVTCEAAGAVSRLKKKTYALLGKLTTTHGPATAAATFQADLARLASYSTPGGRVTCRRRRSLFYRVGKTFGGAAASLPTWPSRIQPLRPRRPVTLSDFSLPCPSPMPKP